MPPVTPTMGKPSEQQLRLDWPGTRWAFFLLRTNEKRHPESSQVAFGLILSGSPVQIAYKPATP